MATGAPGTNGVWQYGEDDSEATFSALLNKVASTTNTQIGVDRGRLTAVEGRATALEARKISGLVPLIPGSATFVDGTGSVNSLGQVNFSNCTGVLLTGIFTSEYRNYCIKFEGYKNAVTGNDNVYLRMALNGSVISGNSYETAAYGHNANDGAGQNLGGGSTSLIYFTRAYDANVPFAGQMDIFTPATTNYTRFSGLSYGRTSGQGQQIITQGMHWQGTAYDGFAIGMSANRFYGTFSVYGYND